MLPATPVAANVDVILNPHAGGLKRSRVRRSVVGEADRAGARVHETRNLEELDEVARAIAGRGAQAVVLAGGDGSFMCGLTALHRAFGGTVLPPIGLAPAGTVGTVARNLGLRGPAIAARVLRQACVGGSDLASCQTLRVRDDRGGDRVGFIFGAGLVGRFFDVYRRAARPGRSAAAFIAARVFAGSLVGSKLARDVLAPTPCALTVDGDRHPAAAFSLVVASVVRDLGLHFLLTYRAGERADQFHVVASGLSPRALGPQMPRVMAGRRLVGEPRVDALARSLRLDFPDPVAYVLDGEVLDAAHVVVDIGPTLRIVRA
jgi:diacylglycerol kinase family enzyme